MKIKKNCKICNKEFDVYKYRKNTANFCSQRCLGLFRKGKVNLKLGRDCSGNKNPMYGKKHSEETKKKLSLMKFGQIISDEQRKKQSIRFSGNKNPMYGKKHSEETKKKMSVFRLVNGCAKLDKNPNWQGGKSFELYGFEFNDYLKKKIRERDDYTCNICLVRDHFSNFPVHHIDYDKKNNQERNLITLCPECHLKTNYHRDNWKIWFLGMMFEKFKKIYNLTISERRLI